MLSLLVFYSHHYHSWFYCQRESEWVRVQHSQETTASQLRHLFFLRLPKKKHRSFSSVISPWSKFFMTGLRCLSQCMLSQFVGLAASSTAFASFFATCSAVRLRGVGGVAGMRIWFVRRFTIRWAAWSMLWEQIFEQIFKFSFPKMTETQLKNALNFWLDTKSNHKNRTSINELLN